MEKKVEDVLEILQKIFDCADLEGRYLTEKQWDILNDTANIKEYLRKELDKAREEGYQNCMDDIWEKARELRAWTEHDGNICANDIEAGLQEAYLEISKLKQ